MTKEQFWEKWIVRAYGGHVPVWLLLQKEKFLNDLDLVIQDDIDRQINTPSSTVTWTFSPNRIKEE